VATQSNKTSIFMNSHALLALRSERQTTGQISLFSETQRQEIPEANLSQ
jgi:hypothetical protein